MAAVVHSYCYFHNFKSNPSCCGKCTWLCFCVFVCLCAYGWPCVQVCAHLCGGQSPVSGDLFCSSQFLKQGLLLNLNLTDWPRGWPACHLFPLTTAPLHWSWEQSSCLHQLSICPHSQCRLHTSNNHSSFLTPTIPEEPYLRRSCTCSLSDLFNLRSACCPGASVL